MTRRSCTTCPSRWISRRWKNSSCWKRTRWSSRPAGSSTSCSSRSTNGTKRPVAAGANTVGGSLAIEVSHLSKVYEGKVAAVEDVTFQVSPGVVFGLLGPNGAGKTTTMRVLITVLRPTGGSARVLGMDVVEQATQVRQVIGYVPQERA